MKNFFTPKEVVKIIGISYRQIQYWDKTHFLKPSYRRRGKYRLYNFTDLIQLRLVRILRGHGASIQRLRRTVRTLKSLLPQCHHPLVELTFLIEDERMLIFNGEVLMDAGSGRSYIRFEVKSLMDDIERMFPEVPEVASGSAAA